MKNQQNNFFLPFIHSRGSLLAIVLCLIILPDLIGGPKETFHKLMKEEWVFRIQQNPFFATQQGIKEADHKLPSQSIKEIERRHKFYQSLLERLNEIPVNQLEESEQINYKLFKYEVKERLRKFQYKDYLVPISAVAVSMQILHALPK